MLLNNLILQNFRSYSKKQFFFNKKLIIIVGPNTSGKTNILEAIFLLATGKSFRAEKETEMLSYQGQVARITGEIEKNEGKDKLELVLTRGEMYGKRIASKKYFINGVPRRTIDFVGRLKVSLFWPEDLELITDSPSTRRRYLDFILTQTSKEYLVSLRSYEKALRSRNRLLEKIREGEAKREELFYWNNLLITNGNYLTAARKEYLEFINSMDSALTHVRFRLIYDASLISKERLEQYALEEVNAATTLVGPHRDDIEFRIQSGQLADRINEDRNLSLFGSRGEQRLGILWLKLGELAFLKEKNNGDKPVLLLDDIFSEFDHQNRQLVFECIGDQQTIITTTDMHLIEDKLRKQAQIIELT